jgi:hypothetical protein
MTWDLPALLAIQEEGVLRIFITLKKSIALAGFELATFRSSSKHTNHYTTKATKLRVNLWFHIYYDILVSSSMY